MANIKAKLVSNLIKLGIVMFIFFEYHFQSIAQKLPLTADNCKGLLFIAMAGFLILLPIDGSVFVKNLYSAKGQFTNDNGDNHKNTDK